jgi:hypothetical protein
MATAKSEAVTIAETVVDRVNRLHEEARSDAVSAVKKGVELGKTLSEVKGSLKHGEFQKWIDDNCKFSYPTAALYMKAAKQNSNALDFSPLRQLYGPKKDKDDAKERDQKDAKRETAALSKVESEIVELNNGLEGMSLPVTTPELFVADAGDAFLSEKAAQRLEWLVGLFDTLANKATLPGK